MKAWEEILQRAPTVALDLDESPYLGLVADLAAVKIDERWLRDSHILSQLDVRQTHLFLAVNGVRSCVRASLIGAASGRYSYRLGSAVRSGDTQGQSFKK